MPDDDNKVLPFPDVGKEKKPETPPSLSEKGAIQQELFARLMEGSRQLHRDMMFEHVLYYVSVFIGFGTAFTWMIIATLKNAS